MKKNHLIKKEVAEILGIRPSQVQYYTDMGVVIPDVSAPTGRGTRRVYSERNLIEFEIARRAVANGISIENAAVIISGLRAFDESVEKSYGGEFAEIHNDTYWNAESWGEGHSVFLIYEQRQNSVDRIELFYCAITERDEDLFKVEISHNTTSVHVINLTEILENLKSKLKSDS